MKIYTHLRRLTTVAAITALAASCTPGAFGTDDLDFGSCSTPLPGDVDPDLLRKHHKVTLPWVPRKLAVSADTVQSSGRALGVSGNEVFAVDRDNGTLVVLDAAAKLSVKRTIAVGARPEQVIIAPNGDAWVSVRHGGKVVMIPKGAQKVGAEVAVGVEPIGMAVAGNQLFVVVAGEQTLKVIDLTTNQIIQSIDTKLPRPRTVTYARQGSASRFVVVDESGVSKTLVESYDGKLKTSSGTRYLRTTNPAQKLSFSSKKLRAWRATGAAVHPETGDTLIAHVLVSPGTQSTLLTDAKLSTFGNKGKSSSSGGYGSTGGAACDPSSPTRPVEVSLTQISKTTTTKTERQFAIADPNTGRNFLTRFDQPSDVIHHPAVSLAFMTNYGTDNVLVLNTGRKDVMEMPIAEIAVGQAPKAIVLSPDGKRAFVLNQHEFSVSEIDLAPLLDLTVDDYVVAKGDMPKQTKPLFLKPVRTVAFATDPNPAIIQQGRRLFTFTGNSKISRSQRFACMSCHLEGTEDKQTWFVADGPRQTPSLAGRLLGTGPFNWTGSEHKLQSNMDRTIERMGGQGLSKTELAALEQFMLHGLVPPPNPHFDGKLTEAQARGKKLFFDPVVACGKCHTGGTGSDAQNWDVGTVTKTETTIEQMRASMTGSKPRLITYNTPSLRGLYYTKPYLHDGSAKTLMDVLNRTSKTMGKTSHLSTSQKNDLVAYLKTL
ncbi:MAG: c-type cytochrome [Myxococcales bacterium]|nr:c-type cytochrome [Myxococcales bacterium]